MHSAFFEIANAIVKRLNKVKYSIKVGQNSNL